MESNIRKENNELGRFIHTARMAKGYSMEEVCRGICSVPTMARIERGERMVDYLMIEILLERMNISKEEYEFILDNNDYQEYMDREKIRTFIAQKELEQAEKKLELYERRHAKKPIHQQFVFLQRGYLEKYKNILEKKEIKKLFHNAISITSPEYWKNIEQRKVLSNTELNGLVELIECIDDSEKREKKQEIINNYFELCHEREQLYPIPYRNAMRYYAENLYRNEKYAKCIEVCNKIMKELYATSKLENREKIFELRARAREKIGFETEEERKQCIKDFLTAYYVSDFYNYESKEIRNHVERVYECQFIE